MMVEMFSMSLSAVCDEDFGNAKYVILKFDNDCAPRLCHMGIFTCSSDHMQVSRTGEQSVEGTELTFEEGVVSSETIY